MKAEVPASLTGRSVAKTLLAPEWRKASTKPRRSTSRFEEPLVAGLKPVPQALRVTSSAESFRSRISLTVSSPSSFPPASRRSRAWSGRRGSPRPWAAIWIRRAPDASFLKAPSVAEGPKSAAPSKVAATVAASFSAKPRGASCEPRGWRRPKATISVDEATAGSGPRSRAQRVAEGERTMEYCRASKSPSSSARAAKGKSWRYPIGTKMSRALSPRAPVA